jgi:serine/threonine protein kinase
MTISKPTHAEAHLSADQLHLLLSDGISSTEYQNSAFHLENCDTCQSRLTELAGDPSWWTAVRNLLSDGPEYDWQPNLDSTIFLYDTKETQESVANQLQRLLGSPNHPEMLGRLGRYDIEKIIGSGGMGIVLKAHDSELNRPIAIKLLAPHLSHSGAARERFAREGRAAAAVVHQHVVAIYNVEADGTLPFLTMQYVPGRSLQTRVDEDGPLGVEEILRIGVQAAAGLAAAHAQGLVHRDVKPSNILLEDTVERAILTDFGLARAMDDASLTQTGVIAGTPHYMSPEQATGGTIDARSDLFSLGAVLYFMMTGHPPFRAPNALAVLHRICREAHRPVWHWNKDVPEELCDIVDQLLEKKPGRRPASAEQTQQQLAALLSHIQQHGLQRRGWIDWRSKRNRRKILAAFATLLVVTALAVSITNLWTRSQQTQSPPTAAAIAESNSREAEFFTELNQIQQDLTRSSHASVFLQQFDQQWSGEVEALHREIDGFETNSRDFLPK